MNMRLKKVIATLLLCSLLSLPTAGCSTFSSPVYYTMLDEDTIKSFTSLETAIRLTANDLGLEKMEIIAEDKDAILYFNPKTTEIALKRKASGQVWYSNPQDRPGSSDSLLNTQFIVTTLNGRDVAKQWNTFDDSVAFGQFTAQRLDNGINVNYLMGKVLAETLYPVGMTEARFTELSAQMASDKDRNYLKRMYGRVDLTTIESLQQREDLKKTFAKLDTELGGVMYVLKSMLSKLEQKNLTTALQNAGYAFEIRQADEAGVGYTGGADTQENFVFSVTYKLENGTLAVDVDPTKILATDKLKISQITVLRNFGAQKPGREGYLFVPDGSGAIISAQNARATVWADYNRKVYGQDYGVLRTDRVDYSEQTYLPVYGAYHDQGGFIGVAEQGDGQMSVLAGIAGTDSAYSYVCSDFTLLSFALVALESSSKNALNLYPRQAVDDPISLRYLFCDSAGTSYDDLADLYRDYLLANGQLDGINDRQGLTVAVNAIGTIDEIKSVMGYPAQIVKELTSLDEVIELGQLLKEAAPAADRVVQYAGWQKGGFQTGYIRSPQTERKLGSNQDLSDLSASLQDLGVSLLPVVEPQYCYDAGWMQGFSPLNHAIRFITRDTGYKPEHNIANFYLDDKGLKPYIIRPDLVAENMTQFMQKYSSMNISGISLGSLASEVYSDFRAQNVLSVNDTIHYFRSAVEAGNSGNNLVGGYGANVYVLSGLDYALGLPVTSSNHPIISRSVPFLQMVLSGSVSYTMPALNQTENATQYFLKAIETGSGVYFDYFADAGSAIMKTRYDYLYGAARSSIWPIATELAAQTSSALQAVANHRITSHEQLAPGIFRTVYDNGWTVTVNYNSANWQDIPAMGYAAVQQEG
ncbi:MAG TPA: hypothetical protein DCM45_04255 [Clostridiales bacterium]|nr:hypothetical protein [Clostridiales bacterium]